MTYFAVSTDDVPTNKRFAASLDCDYPILADPGKTIAGAYGVLASGSGYASRWTFTIGPDGKILDIDKQVKPQTAGKDLAKRLETLGVAKAK